MPEAPSDERRAAIRDICEGALPTHERVAAATGVHVKTISRRAGKEGWKTLDLRHQRVRTAHRHMITVAARAAAGEELDPVDEEAELEAARFGAVDMLEEPEPWPDESPASRIARIVALSERIAVMAREEAVRQSIASDEELAEELQIINLRILYLAEGHARYLAVTVFGIPEEEVDAKLPEPVDRSEPLRRERERRRKAEGRWD